MAVRVFIAVTVPCGDLITTVLRDLGRLGRAVKPVQPKNLHMTIRFLGNIDRDQIDDVAEAIRMATADQATFACEMVGLGAFPTPRCPSVVWVGIESAGPLTAIAENLVPALHAAGMAGDGKPFHPHVTIARVGVRPPALLGQLLESHRQTRFGGVTVGKIDLMESMLHPDGARYSILDSIALSKYNRRVLPQDPDSSEEAMDGQWTDLCAVSDIAATGGHYVETNDRGLAVFRVEPSGVHVIDNTCPHAGGSLAGGYVDNGCVICPWHGWPFELGTGQCPDNPQIGVSAYPTRIVGGRVQAMLDRSKL